VWVLLVLALEVPVSAYRTRVWAEPCLLACAVKKLGGSVERWLGVAERLFGPYLWGR